jgi:hypothetical protein
LKLIREILKVTIVNRQALDLASRKERIAERQVGFMKWFCVFFNERCKAIRKNGAKTCLVSGSGN